jgi:transposase
LCWAHFTRNLLSAQELARTPAAKRFCREALALQRQLFRLWHRFRGDPHVRGAPLSRPELIAKVRPIEKKCFALAERHVNAADADVSNPARALFVHHPHFFTFVHEEGVEPTNNAATAASGIGGRMPRAGLCRVAEFAPVDVGFQLGTDAA